MPAISIREIDENTRARLLSRARARGWSYGQYIGQLVALHDAVRALADAGDDGLQAELVALGLETQHG